MRHEGKCIYLQCRKCLLSSSLSFEATPYHLKQNNSKSFVFVDKHFKSNFNWFCAHWMLILSSKWWFLSSNWIIVCCILLFKVNLKKLLFRPFFFFFNSHTRAISPQVKLVIIIKTYIHKYLGQFRYFYWWRAVSWGFKPLIMTRVYNRL